MVKLSGWKKDIEKRHGKSLSSVAGKYVDNDRIVVYIAFESNNQK